MKVESEFRPVHVILEDKMDVGSLKCILEMHLKSSSDPEAIYCRLIAKEILEQIEAKS